MQQATATFTNRRDAEMAVEQIIQEYGLDPNAVEILPESSENSVGTKRSGSDIDHASDPANVPMLAGRLIVSVTIGLASADKIQAALTKHGGKLPS